MGAKAGGSATRPPLRVGRRRFAGRVARVRLPCCRVFYVGGYSDTKLTGCKDSRLRRARWSPKPIERLNLGLVYGRILSLTTCRALRKAPLRQRKVAAARTARLPSPAPRLRKKQASAPQTRPDATSDPHRIALGPSAARAARLVSSGGYIAAHRVCVALSSQPWSPRPKHHRKKKQRRQLC